MPRNCWWRPYCLTRTHLYLGAKKSFSWSVRSTFFEIFLIFDKSDFHQLSNPFFALSEVLGGTPNRPSPGTGQRQGAAKPLHGARSTAARAPGAARAAMEAQRSAE